MTTLAISVAGSVLKISAGVPATQDTAGFAALTYTTVAEITDMGSLGKDFTLITHNPVNDRKTYKLKGSYNTGSLQLKMAKAPTDAGQVLLLAALASDSDYAFHILVQGGTHMYFQGKVMSYVTAIGSVNNIYAADTKVEITSEIFES